MLQPDKRTLLVTGKNYTVIALWMRDRLLKKGLEVICSENEINCSRKVSENEIHQQKTVPRFLSERRKPYSIIGYLR